MVAWPLIKKTITNFLVLISRNLNVIFMAMMLDPNLKIDADLDCRIQRMTFNPEKGPFLEGKTVVGEFQSSSIGLPKSCSLKKSNWRWINSLLFCPANFFWQKFRHHFCCPGRPDNLSFRKAASFLSNNIRTKLEPYDISESITHLTGSLDNSEPEYQTPLIHLRLNVDNKTITTLRSSLNNTSFTATFNNEEIKGKGHED